MLPGDFGLCYNNKGFSWIIVFLQKLIGDNSRYTHSFIVLDSETAIEAHTWRGVIKRPLAEYRNVVYVNHNLTDEQRKIIVNEAESILGSEYGWLNYIVIGLMHFNKCPRWLMKRVQKSNKYVCSQLVCHVYEKAGVQILGPMWTWLNTTPGRLSYLLGANDV